MGGYVNRTKIAQLYADAESLGGQTVTVAGWVKSVRDMKNFGFVTLNDGSCFRDLQVVMNREALDNYDEIAHQNVSAALICTGTVKLTPDAPQPFELSATSIEVEGTSAPDYPLQKKRATVEFLRTQQHLRPRTNLFRAVFRIRSVAAAAIHRFFQEQGFVYVNTPIITTSDCEGAGEMFRVTTLDPKNPPLTESGEVDWSQDFFGKHASLTVSGQLNAENFAMAFGDVYTFGPTFRAENSNTTRHAAEFWMIEPEMAFADLNDYMDNAEAMLKYVLKDVMATCPDELNMLNKFVDKGLLERLDHVANSDFARVTYTEAVEILEQAVAAGHKFDYPVSWGIDLQTEHERFLTDEHFKHMAEVSGTNIRELESFCERCAGEAGDREREGSELSFDDIDAIASQYFDTSAKKINVQTVQSVIEEQYGVTHEELIGPRRNANIAKARHIAIYLAIEMCEMTTTAVGAEFGNRNHSTVSTSYKKVQKMIQEDRTITEDLKSLRDKITLRS